ncbi:hypothetical protein LSCM1_01555 [Leishmania martiniquensis]|uniref:Uncharacterized protein n=1 Tax=Leishmania martiniquensis TaxID=1580590 RepID=A0A836GAU0_9TRYP|nr:hypothetical protein LSCM1_01555 [Leishmania martiniquensis]
MSETQPPSVTSATQVVVQKRGTYERGRWSTRILTIDPSTCMVTISRKNKPQDVSHRSLLVEKVEMWPHYSCNLIENKFSSLKAKLVLCITGKEVPLTNRTPVRSMMRSSIQALVAASVAAEDSITGTSSTKRLTVKDIFSRNNPVFHTSSSSSSNENTAVSWVVTFPSIDSFELAVMLFLRCKNQDGSKRKVFTTNATEGLMKVKKEWESQLEGVNTVHITAVP